MWYNNNIKSHKRYTLFNRFGLLFVIVTVVLIWSNCNSQKNFEVKKIFINGKTLYVQIADEPHERMRGLQRRKGLFDNWGMLFVYEKEQFVQFWMKDTVIPLDLAFIDSQGTIFEIHHMKPQDTTIYQSQKKARYVLEVNRNWFEDNGIGVGDIIEGLK